MDGPVEQLHAKTWMCSVDWAAVADRLEIIVECLANDRLAETVSVDHAAAARAVDYCRRRAAKQRYSRDEMEARETEMINFILAHGQSLDWVMVGDPVDMITTLAAGTNSRKRPQLRIV